MKKGNTDIYFIAEVILVLVAFVIMLAYIGGYFNRSESEACKGFFEQFKAFIYEPLGISGGTTCPK